MAGFMEPPQTTDPVELLRYFQKEAQRRETPKAELPKGILERPTEEVDDKSYGVMKFFADWWSGTEDKVAEARQEVMQGLVNMPMPSLPTPDMPDELMDVPTAESEPVLEGAPEKPEMGSREPYELEVDTIGNEALDRNGMRLVDVTDTEEGKLSNEEALFEMGKQIREETIKTEGLMSKPSDDSADGVQPTDGKDPTQDLLDRIAFGEGADPAKLVAQEKHGIGTSQYDMVYNYGDTLAPSKPVSEMTMQELYDFQTDLINATKGTVPGTKLGTSAVGKYQVIRKSLFGSGTANKPSKNSWADKLNLKADTVYTPEIQEKIAMLALKEAGYESFIRGNKTEKAFHDKIANIWASVAKASGKDTYGQGIHTVKADLEPMYELLKPVKTENTNRPTSPRPMLRPDEEEE